MSLQSLAEIKVMPHLRKTHFFKIRSTSDNIIQWLSFDAQLLIQYKGKKIINSFNR